MHFLKFLKAKLLQTLLEDNFLINFPYSSKTLQTVVGAREFWLPMWVSSNYLALKTDCGRASCDDGNAVSENVSLM